VQAPAHKALTEILQGLLDQGFWGCWNRGQIHDIFITAIAGPPMLQKLDYQGQTELFSLDWVAGPGVLPNRGRPLNVRIEPPRGLSTAKAQTRGASIEHFYDNDGCVGPNRASAAGTPGIAGANRPRRSLLACFVVVALTFGFRRRQVDGCHRVHNHTHSRDCQGPTGPHPPFFRND